MISGGEREYLEMKERIDNSNKLNQMVGDAVLYLRDSDEELKKKLEAMKGG